MYMISLDYFFNKTNLYFILLNKISFFVNKNAKYILCELIKRYSRQQSFYKYSLLKPRVDSRFLCTSRLYQ